MYKKNKPDLESTPNQAYFYVVTYTQAITRLYNETATRIDLDVIDTLCSYLQVSVGELLEQKID
ncbi:MAG TPA: hypothetical protein DEV59_02155 [Proteus sp.]|nr:hypothetical protein [Proteus sp. (in: enterobacteria)]